MRPSELLKAKKADIEKLFKKYPLITNPRIFGSVARGDDVEGSDIDLLVDAQRGTTLLDLGELQDELQELLGVEIDLLTPEDISKNFRYKVLNEAVML